MNALLALLVDGNVQWVLAGTLLLGVSSGILGSFAMLRRRSLMGDVLAHAALPGVCVAFMLTQSRTVAPLLVGAIIAGIIGTWCVDTITRHSRIKEDTAQALILAVFFGLGIVLLTHIARSGAAGQSGLDRFLFGQAASLIGSDVKIIGTAALVLTLGVTLLFKEFKLLSFDPAFGAGIGFPMRALDRVLMLMVVTSVAIGLQAVGVIMMSALLITPAAAARYWTERLEVMVVLAGLIGGSSGVAGTLISLAGPRLATGPLIVLVATSFFLVSLTFGTRRGWLKNMLNHLKVRQRVAHENFLRTVYEAKEIGVGWQTTSDHPGEPFTTFAVPVNVIRARLGWSPSVLRRQIRRAIQRGLIEFLGAKGEGAPNNGVIQLTNKGFAQAREVVRRHRLWEMFLMHEADFAVDHLDRDADDIEHFLPPDVVAELERRLREDGPQSSVPPSPHPL